MKVEPHALGRFAHSETLGVGVVSVCLRQEGLPMARDEQRLSSWRERRQEAKRAKARRTSDTPEKQHEHPSETPSGAKETADRAGTAVGVVSGGVGGS
jgi:hypothetical protein